MLLAEREDLRGFMMPCVIHNQKDLQGVEGRHQGAHESLKGVMSFLQTFYSTLLVALYPVKKASSTYIQAVRDDIGRASLHVHPDSFQPSPKTDIFVLPASNDCFFETFEVGFLEPLNFVII